MKPSKPVDYLAAIEQLRQEEQSENSQIHNAPGIIPTNPEEPVDYQAVSKAWDKQQAGKYTIYTTEQEDEGRL